MFVNATEKAFHEVLIETRQLMMVRRLMEVNEVKDLNDALGNKRI